MGEEVPVPHSRAGVIQIGNRECAFRMSKTFITGAHLRYRETNVYQFFLDSEQCRARGSHRQFHHPTKPGTVTVAGAMSKDLPLGTLKQIYRQAGSPRGQK